MHPETIKAEIRKGFRTVKAFETAKGLAKGSVRDVLRGRKSTRTAKAIAAVVQKPMSELFPDRFGTADNKSQKRDSHGLSEGAR